MHLLCTANCISDATQHSLILVSVRYSPHQQMLQIKVVACCKIYRHVYAADVGIPFFVHWAFFRNFTMLSLSFMPIGKLGVKLGAAVAQSV
jgi:hypothetical protein